MPIDFVNVFQNGESVFQGGKNVHLSGKKSSQSWYENVAITPVRLVSRNRLYIPTRMIGKISSASR